VDLTADGSAQGGEIQWKPGQKLDAACPVFNTGNNPPKDEFTNVAEYSDKNTTTGDTYFYGAMIRSTNNGNADGSVEFNQGTATPAGCRTVGDRMITFDFLNGGTTLNLKALKWQTTGTCLQSNDLPPCWVDVTPASNTGTLFVGGSNQTAGIANGMSTLTLGVNQFSEFGVNLTQFLGLTGCNNFPTQIWESRASGSSATSNPEDIEIVTSLPISSCGSIKIVKATDPTAVDQDFGFTTTGGNGFGGAAAGVDAGSFTLNAHATSTSSVTYSDLPAGTYTVTETEPSKWSLKTMSCDKDSSSSNSLTATINLVSGDSVTAPTRTKRRPGISR
jgi:hypothetical protein